MFQITIFFLYLTAGVGLAGSRLPRFGASAGMLQAVGFLCAVTGLIWHAVLLGAVIITPGGLALSLGNTVSLIGLEMALIALFSAMSPALRGLAGGMLVLAAFTALATGAALPDVPGTALSWQIQAHILISLFAYGLLSVGAIVAVFALLQDSRLRAGRITAVNSLFAPLETNEKLLYGVAAAGFFGLLVGVVSGLTFVENVFAQHLVHKTVLSLLALLLFGVLLTGRHLAGWRGRRAVYLYLWGFIVLGLAYFGSRYVLEYMLNSSWS